VFLMLDDAVEQAQAIRVELESAPHLSRQRLLR
jgi:hypothetical protein